MTWTNQADKETNFVGTVDNQSTSSEVKNFLIGPTIGKNGQPNGVIQFINKIDENGDVCEITEADVQKFNDMKDLFGMCIDNTSQIAQTIGVTLSINDTMKKITGLMDQEEDQQE